MHRSTFSAFVLIPMCYRYWLSLFFFFIVLILIIAVVLSVKFHKAVLNPVLHVLSKKGEKKALKINCFKSKRLNFVLASRTNRRQQQVEGFRIKYLKLKRRHRKKSLSNKLKTTLLQLKRANHVRLSGSAAGEPLFETAAPECVSKCPLLGVSLANG